MGAVNRSGKQDIIERDIYSLISAGDGIKARDIGRRLGLERSVINHYLYSSPYMHELCYRDSDYLWHALIRQGHPHTGLGDFCGYYGSVSEFMELGGEEWLLQMKDGCRRIGRNLNDARGLFHSFSDTRETMRALFADLAQMGLDEALSWETAFELRINRSRMIRIYADVLVITAKYVFSLEFKMKDSIDPQELAQAAKYTEYLEVLFGKDYDVVPVLVLTRADELYRYEELEGTTAELPVCSGNMLFNVFDEYLGFLTD